MKLPKTNPNLHFPCILQSAVLFVFMILLSFHTSCAIPASANETDKFALLKFKEQIEIDPNGIFDSWNKSIHFCSWFGVTCNRRHQDRVRSLVLDGQQLVGTISAHVGNLSFLREISLENNTLHGPIPGEVGNLFRLRFLSLLNNSLEGEIPANLTRCSQLQVLDLYGNNLIGRIPAELGSLVTLEFLELSRNHLTKEIPPVLANLSSLTVFSIRENKLVGNIPHDMDGLQRLKYFSVFSNNLSGTIPQSLLNISSIEAFVCGGNILGGALPESIGLTLPNLRFFVIGRNNFSGLLPQSLGNASKLEVLNIVKNSFRGQVPSNLGNLKNLWRLSLSKNFLGNNSTNDLRFISSLRNCTKLKILSISENFLGGVLPNSVANLSVQLSFFYAGYNYIGGPIPEGLQNLVHLILLSLGNNLHAGSIHSFDFGKFQKLQVLYLSGNQFTGQIPSSVGNLSQLIELFMDQNRFEGSIPSTIGNCRMLLISDFSSNNLSGPIPKEILVLPSLLELHLSQNMLTDDLPEEVGKLKHLGVLDVSDNKLSNGIPSAIGDCSMLQYLYMGGNLFEGDIPSSLASLKSLEYLNLSQNNLTGKIPQVLANLSFMQFLDISFNDLEGEVPVGGIFGNASAINLTGNIRLCGGIPELHRQKCPPKATKRRKSGFLKHVFLPISVLLCVLLAFITVILYRIRNSRKQPLSDRLSVESRKLISYGRLYKATDGFSDSNVLGKGNFGTVYKGSLDEIEKPIAVKVLNLQQKGAFKSITAECNALRNIRHRNLVKLITYCSSLDYKGNEFKALIFEFMANGSLEKWLHPEAGVRNQSNNLSLLQRLCIAIDVASALHYLHDLCERAIIHCDLKPSNILLDEDMVAHITDFGLARLFSATEDLSQSTISTIGIRGTVGYAAPEYGVGSIASKEGDVYSYGILLLEMFSGRKPTDDMFKDDLNLHKFVKAALPNRLMQIVETTILNRDAEETRVTSTVEPEGVKKDLEIVEEGTNNYHHHVEVDTRMCLLSILEIGVACSVESPEMRMCMGDVTRKLHSIKKAFLGSQAHQERRFIGDVLVNHEKFLHASLVPRRMMH